MLVIPTTKESGSRYRAIVRVDQTEFHLAGLYLSQVDAMAKARAVVDHFERDIRDRLKRRSMFRSPTHAGIPRE